MTVKTLISKLQELNPNYRVVVRGYEGGYDDVEVDEKSFKLILNKHTAWYYGKHERLDENNKEMNDKIVNAYCL